jgi:hypothetical protein
MRISRLTYLGVFAAALVLVPSLRRASSHLQADDDDRRLRGAWRITISSPPDCRGAPPACFTASELANFYLDGTLTETNTILFATGEPNPPNFSGASDGYGVWKRTDTPGVFSILFQKFLFQTQTVPTSVSPTGKLVVNTAIATLTGKYVVNSDGTLSGSFTITITPPKSNTVLFEAVGTVQGARVGGSDRD